MTRNLFSKFSLAVITLGGAALFLISCASVSGPANQSFNPDYTTTSTSSTLSVEQEVQQRELEGYVARTSARNVMRLPKDLDLTLSGALKRSTRVEFIEPEVEYPSHMYPYRLTNYSSAINYRPLFNDRFSVSEGIR